jgi:hypothetical protein
LWRATAFRAAFFAAGDFRLLFEFGDFFGFPDFGTGAFFCVFRATFDFLLFAIAILLDV